MTIHHDVKMSGEQNKPVPWSLRQAICERVVAVSHDEKLSTVIPQIVAGDVAPLVVLREGEAVGVVAVGNLERAPAESMVADVCSPIRGMRANPDLLLSVGERFFRDGSIELLVLNEAGGRIAGFVTRGSLATAAVRETENLRAWIDENDLRDEPRVHTTSSHASESIQAEAARSLRTPESDRAALASALEFSESRYQAILEAQPECVKVVDRDGCLREINPAGLRIMEADRFDQVRGVKISALLSPEYQAKYQEWERRILAGEKATLVFEAEGLKGTKKWLEAIGTPLRNASGEIEASLSVTRDITDRVIAEKQLRENEQRLRKIFNGLPYYLTLFTAGGELSLVNQTALQSPGFAVDVLKGKQIWETEWINFDPAVQERVRAAFFRAQNGLSSRFDSTIRMPSGEMKQMEITVHPVCDEDGAVREILGAGVDITARVEAEEQARRFRDEIAHASRLSTLGEMAANIAHELNQPLAAIVNYAFSARTLLADIAGPDSGRCAQYLSVVEEQSLRAGHIVRSLQQLVRKTRSHHGAADLGRIFEDVLSLIKSDLYHERIELVTNFSPDLPVILVDSVQIQQVVLNLVRNSIEALAGVDGGRRIEIATQQQDDRVLVSVSDSGPGIPDAPFDNIFDAFVSTKPDGLGLGLTISRRIIDAHGGELWYESPAGRGATFSFTLPVSHQKETDE
ncbi:MAG: PAS domain S-box protein [Planctomycetaceae bacterium]